MAKSSGLGDNFYLHGYNVSGDIGSINTTGGPALLEQTGIDKKAYERIGGHRSGGMSWSAFFNPANDQAHDRLSLLPAADQHCAYFRGTALGAEAACLVAKQLNYDGNRGNDGALTFSVEAQSNGFGLEWGKALTPGVRTDVAATNGTGIDTLAAASFGAQAYLQVFALTGTDATVKIQDSADNITFADVAGLTFAQVTTGRSAQRLATANNATIRRYLRAVTVTTGGFTSCAFAAVIVKNETAGQVF